MCSRVCASSPGGTCIRGNSRTSNILLQKTLLECQRVPALINGLQKLRRGCAFSTLACRIATATASRHPLRPSLVSTMIHQGGDEFCPEWANVAALVAVRPVMDALAVLRLVDSHEFHAERVTTRLIPEVAPSDRDKQGIEQSSSCSHFGTRQTVNTPVYSHK